MDQRTDLDLELSNRQRLLGWWDLAGLEADYPASTATVCKLLRATEYQNDNDLVLQASNDGWIPPVEKSGGRLQWDATAIVTLAAAFEARRLWVRNSKIHGHKQTLAERLRELVEAEGGDGAINDLEKFDWPGLLGMLINVSGDAGAVQTMAEAIRQKLRTEGIL